MDLTGKRVVVVGGAGGIGRAACDTIAAAGAAVFAIDRETAIRTVPPEITGVAADLTSEDDVRAAAQVVSAAPVHGLVVASGVQLHGRDGRIGDVATDVWEHTMAVNLTGTFLSVRELVPALIAAEGASVVLVGSPTGVTMEAAGYAAYSASKAGMMGLARGIASDYASDGIRANVVIPGPTRTPLIDALLGDPAVADRMASRVPLGRVGEPGEVAGIIRWLLSDESRYATGAFFAVDGGITAR